MSAGPVTGHEMGHPLQPNTMLVPARPVPGLGAILPPARSVLTPAQPGRHRDYRECVLDLRTKPPGKTSITRLLIWPCN